MMKLSLSGAAARRTAIIASLALAGVMTGCMNGGWMARATFQETRAVEADYIEQTGLEVMTANGSIVVMQAPEQDYILITATIRAISQERLDQTQIVAQRDPTGALVIEARWPDGVRRNNEGCSFEIETPGAYGVNLTSKNGAISIDGLQGDAVLITSNGRVTAMDHAGDVTAKTSNGRITYERVTGDMVARTSNGRVRLIEVDGSVYVDTSNGSVTVELAQYATGPVRIDTSNGGVKLRLSEAFEGELVLDTSHGGLSYDMPVNIRSVRSSKRHAVLQIGEGGPSSIVSTSNGSIVVEVAVASDE